MGWPAEKVHVVGMGPNHTPAPEGPGGGGGAPAAGADAAPRFLFVGREWERKHGPLLLRAFARLRAEIPDARLDLVGGHPPVSAPGVTGHGPLALDRPDEAARVSALFGAATCFVMPSEVEPFGLAYIEAAVAGVPSIATSVGGAGTIVAEGTGLLVPPGRRGGAAGRDADARGSRGRAADGRRGARAVAAVRLGAGRGAAAARAGAAGRRGRGVPVSWAVCVLNWNGREDTLRCLASLRGERVIVADNGSSDGSVEAIRSAFPDVEVVENGANLGFSGGNNAAIRRALDGGAEWVVLLNNDAEAEPGLLDALPGGRRSGIRMPACWRASSCSPTGACSGRASGWGCAPATPAARGATAARTASRSRSRAARSARWAR